MQIAFFPLSLINWITENPHLGKFVAIYNSENNKNYIEFYHNDCKTTGEWYKNRFILETITK